MLQTLASYPYNCRGEGLHILVSMSLLILHITLQRLSSTEQQ